MKILKTANKKTKIVLSKKEWESIGKKANWIKVSSATIDKPIIPDAINALSKEPNAVKFNDKANFDNFLKEQKYFSPSYSHCYYSIEDLEASYRGESEWRDGSKGISEADKGCVMLFETGRELVAIWDERNRVGYIVPSE